MKKFFTVFLALLMLFSLSACTAEKADDGVYNIGICQYSQHESLDLATQGFKDALTEKLGADKVNFDYQNASDDPGVCATIINTFVSSEVDLILANATPALQSAAAATTEIPVLGTSVTEYGVALEIDYFDGTVGGNVSGTVDLAPLTKQAQMIIDLFPETKEVGIIYCSSEPNSIYQVKIVKEYLEEKGITVTQYAFSDSNDIAAVTTTACQTSDVIYIPTDNTAAASAEVIDGVCRPEGVPVITGDKGTAAKCGVAVLGISYYNLGYTTGEMAVRILTGEADISTMPVEYDEDVDFFYNAEICEELGVTVPENYVALS